MKDMMLLIEPLIPSLRRYACALVGDVAMADDLVQGCLERAISRWHQRRADGDARTWVFTILHNLAMTHLRQKMRRGRHVPVDEVNDVNAVELSCSASQESRLRHRDLLRAMSTLPEDQRSVLLLVGVEDLSYAEAARVLSIPMGTVMSRLARAREKLLKAMDGDPATDMAPAPRLQRVK